MVRKGSVLFEAAKRLVVAFIAFVVIVTIVFWAFRVAPDDSFTELLGHDIWTGDQASVDGMSLDEPLIVQYFDYLGDTLRGDLYESYTHANDPVTEIVLQNAKPTVLLFVMSFALSTLVAILYERFFAYPRSSLRDWLGSSLAALFISVQITGLGFALIVWNERADGPFESSLREFNLWIRNVDLAGTPAAMAGLALPLMASVCVISPLIWLFVRQGREDTGQDGRAGMLVGVLARLRATVPGPIFLVSWAMLCTVALETAFSSRGLGITMVDAIGRMDQVLVMGCIVMAALLVLVASTVFDILLAIVPEEPGQGGADGAPAAVVGFRGPPSLKGIVLPLWASVKRNRSAMISLTVLVVLVSVASLAPVLSMVDGNPASTDNYTLDVLLDPSLTPSPDTGIVHLLGTDHLGRDLYSLMLYGARGPLAMVGLIAGLTFLLGCAAGLLGAVSAGAPAGLVRALSVPLRGVTYAFASVGLVVLAYYLVVARRMDLIEYSLFFTPMFMGWAWEWVAVPAYRSSMATMAEGVPVRSLALVPSMRLVASRSLRVAKYAVVVGLLIATMSYTTAAMGMTPWPGEYPTWGGILTDAMDSSSLLAGPEAFFLVPFVSLTLLGACAYVLLDRLEAAFRDRSDT